MRTEITRRRSPRHWPLTGKFHGDTDRRLVAALGLIVDGPSSTEAI
jgi:hypothetical protein